MNNSVEEEESQLETREREHNNNLRFFGTVGPAFRVGKQRPCFQGLLARLARFRENTREHLDLDRHGRLGV